MRNWNARLFKLAAMIGCVTIGLANAPKAFALATEHFGNAPISRNWVSAELLPLVNMTNRVYWREVNGDPRFFFRGKTRAVNDALRILSTAKAPVREVILLPGKGVTMDLRQTKTIPFNWSFHPPGGFYIGRARREKNTHVMTRHPTMTIYIDVLGPEKPVNLKQIQRWIADLDNANFAKRSKAFAELQKLGHSAGPALRRALKGKSSEEKTQRIEALLERLTGIDLDALVIPKGIRALSVNDILKRNFAGLNSPDYLIRGLACGNLGHYARFDDAVVPKLVDILKNAKHEYVRRSAAGALGRLGRRAAKALPILKLGVNDPDINVRNSYKHAIKQIESAKEDPDFAAKLSRRRAILRQIEGKLKQRSD